jgi:hypothetical protein
MSVPCLQKLLQEIRILSKLICHSSFHDIYLLLKPLFPMGSILLMLILLLSQLVSSIGCFLIYYFTFNGLVVPICILLTLVIVLTCFISDSIDSEGRFVEVAQIESLFVGLFEKGNLLLHFVYLINCSLQ